MRRAIALLATVTLFAALIGCGGSSDTTTADSGTAAPPAHPGPPPGMAQPAGGGSAAAPAASAEESGTPAETGSADEGEQESASAEADSSSGEAGQMPPQGSGTPGSMAAGHQGPPPGYGMGSPPPGSSGPVPPGYPGGPPQTGYGMAPRPPGSSGGSPPPGYMGGSAPPASGLGLRPPGYSGGSPPPGYMSGSAPPGYSGGSPPPGYMSGSAPPGYAGSSPPPGYPGGMRPPGSGEAGSAGESPYAGGTMPYPGGSYPGGPGSPGGPNPPAPLTFDGLAQRAFQQGREADAFKYLWAFALLNDQGASDVLPKVEWVSGLKGPTLGVRWGLGVQITPDSYKGDLKPVGVTQQLPKGPRGGQTGGSEAGGPMGAGYGVPGGGAAGNTNSQLTRYAGELGDRFLNEFQTRVADGKFGQVLRDAPTGGRSGGGSGYGGSGATGPGMMGPGPPYGGSESGGYGASMMPGGGAVGGGRPAPNAISPITAGLCFVGVEPQDKLLSKAAREGLQVLILVKIDVKVNLKTKLITNETELVLLDVAKKAELYSTSGFNNLKIQNDRTNNKKDGVQDEFTKLFEYIDANLVVSPLPTALKPEHVQGRVTALLASKPENLLPVLAEIRYWQRQNMLTEEQMTAAFKQLLGDDMGAELATGEEEAKTKLLEKWLPKA